MTSRAWFCWVFGIWQLVSHIGITPLETKGTITVRHSLSLLPKPAHRSHFVPGPVHRGYWASEVGQAMDHCTCMLTGEVDVLTRLTVV